MKRVTTTILTILIVVGINFVTRSCVVKAEPIDITELNALIEEGAAVEIGSVDYYAWADKITEFDNEHSDSFIHNGFFYKTIAERTGYANKEMHPSDGILYQQAVLFSLNYLKKQIETVSGNSVFKYNDVDTIINEGRQLNSIPNDARDTSFYESARSWGYDKAYLNSLLSWIPEYNYFLDKFYDNLSTPDEYFEYKLLLLKEKLPVSMEYTGLEMARTHRYLVYNEGDTFNADGLEINAVFKVTNQDGSISEQKIYVSNYDVDRTTPLTHTDRQWPVYHTEKGITKVAYIPITVNPILVSETLKSVEIVQEPYKKIYTEGEKFSASGMYLNCNYDQLYSDGTHKTITKSYLSSYTVDQTTPLALEDTQWPVYYTEKGITLVAYIPITVNPTLISETLKSIEISREPNKKIYTEGEMFDASGMYLNCNYEQLYSNGARKTITKSRISSYTVDATTPLTLNDKFVTITVTDGDITLSANQPIIVNPKRNLTEPIVISTTLDSIVITSTPDKTIYKVGQTFDDKGLKVRAIYKNVWSDGFINYSTKENVEYFVDITTPLAAGTDRITVSYTDNRVQKYAEVEIQVQSSADTTRMLPSAVGTANAGKTANTEPTFLSIAKTKYSFKAKSLKKKSKSFKINATGGKITYTVAKAPKGGKKKISVSKSGKVMLKKGIKKGTYKIIVANESSNKTVTVKIK